MKNCLIVLGMHRSGTSAFTGILDLLGVNLGTQMLETQPDNPKGFFENKYAVLANDCILETLNSSWDDSFPLPPDWPSRFEGSQLIEDMRSFLRTDIPENGLFALKDPRLPKLLPLWLPLFATEAITPYFALVIRNPLEIADSLQRRNGFSTEKSLILWMQHMVDSERNTRHLPRGFVKYESLLRDPQQSVAKVFRSAGLDLPKISEDQSEALTQFLDRNMRHHEVSDEELNAKCIKVVADYYRLLCKISELGVETQQDLDDIDKLVRQYEANQALFYNSDVRQIKSLSDEWHTPAWYEAELNRIREQFETDKTYREYRYIANTDYLIKERAALLELKQFLAIPLGVYKKYQAIIEKLLPKGATAFLNKEGPTLLELKKFLAIPLGVYSSCRSLIVRLLPEGTLPRRVLRQCNHLLRKYVVGSISASVRQIGELVRPKVKSAKKPQNSPEDATNPESTPTWEPLTFAKSDRPRVSIIIPVFNNWQFTYKCLQSVHQYTSGNYEIIVVDNNSTDVTPQLLASMQGIRVITNETNQVFVNACNQAASSANGDYLLLLNNDTEVTADWLNAMLEPFSDARTGIVGAKLIYPDGSLQEAGGIIWRDGTGCNYGHGDKPDLPQYSYRKAVDYCSGACLMIPRKLWEEIGGFDQRYAPAYYEDTDLCFAVRAHDYKVIYQPAALVVHYGGASAGKETTSGYKRYQEINRHKFVAKWRETLENDHFFSSDGLFRAREKNGDKHILIIDHYAPTFDKDSGSQRMLCMLKILQDMGYKVSFWPDDLTYDPRYTKTLQDLGIEVFYGDLNFEEFIRNQGNEFDTVLMSRPITAKKYLHLVKKYSNAQTIFDTVDLHFVREQRRLELEVRQWKNLELFLSEETDTTFVVSPTEKDILANEGINEKVAVVSNIHTLEPCLKGFEERRGVLFIGGFVHPPNEEGIIWFIEYILPIIRKKIPELHLTIVGSDPTERLKSLATDRIMVTGYVEDVSGYFNDSRVFVSPLLHGAGIKGKIGQSFSYGLPVVTTSIGAEGMRLTDRQNALISDSEADFANKVIELYTEKFLWQRLSTNCRQVIREQFSTDTIRTALENVLKEKSAPVSPKATRSRPVIVHCHLFKNAGSTLDWSLQRQFGSKFIDHRDDESMRRGALFLGPYIENHKELSAISSHHIHLPLPHSEAFHLLPIVALRHPVDRARSVYDFERRQDSNTPGAIQAKKLSFSDYIRWRMQPDVSPTVRNFHCCFCTGKFSEEIGEQQYLDSVALLARTPQLVIVERYDESMLLLEHHLEEFFPGIDLSYIPQNTTPGRDEKLDRRIKAVFDELGSKLAAEFRAKNHWDLMLYEDAQALLNERLGVLGRIEDLRENFQSRCRSLSADTVIG